MSRRQAMLALLSIGLSACSNVSGPQLPAVPQASSYKEARADAGQSVGTLEADDWWKRYQDPLLDRLQEQLLQNSPDLASALARYEQARAVSDSLRAGRQPTIGISADLLRNRQSERRPLRGTESPDYYNSATLGLNFSYELDLWGRIGQQIAAGEAEEQAAQADLAAAQLALQVQLADTLLALRGADQEIFLLRDTQTAYTRAASMMSKRHAEGLASGLDVARAQAQREAARSQLHQVSGQRAVLEHSIAALVGEHASVFSIEPSSLPEIVPTIPAGLPSELLQRRPDIAAAQRRVSAANSRVGVARTAYFPTLSLSANGGYQSSELSNIVGAPNLFWAVGPGLLANLFDGGRRKAEINRAEHELNEVGQTYRGVVLAAFQQVEDQLVLLDRYGKAAAAEKLAVSESVRALDIASNRYRDGAASYLDVITAQTTALQAQRNEQDLTNRQQRATVQLVRALGGGWTIEPSAQIVER